MMSIHFDSFKKASFTGVLISLGIVFGDIGTSPLYVMNAILKEGRVDPDFIIGAISCIIWTLTFQTTIKYVFITLKADNKGEGGILALFALLRKKRISAYIIAFIGASALLADGIITPSITVTSAVEGLKVFYPQISIVPIVLLILLVLFSIQQFGTSFLGKFFGPIMLVWFSTLGILGISQVIGQPDVLRAFNPVYAYRLLVENPGGILILGAVFLCTTGAEALYSDLGHCGLKNIRISWLFVKSTLILNYLGQGAWILSQGTDISINPFFAIMPVWFKWPGIILSTLAAVIASQALISGTYTIISEAITLNFWPKITIKYPTRIKGQLYIPRINWLLFLSCVFVVIMFQNSSNMEAAYGLSITITMLMTTILMFLFLHYRRRTGLFKWFFLFFYLLIETVFLYANLHKFPNGGWFTLLISSVLFSIMYIWYNGRITKKRFTEFLELSKYKPILMDIQNDQDIPKIASNLVYITRADFENQIESKVIYSILNKQPKRADKYWFLRINVCDEPFTKNYKVTILIPDKMFRIDFYLGFKVDARINRYFYHILNEMEKNGEINLLSQYSSLRKHKIASDFKFIIIDRIPTVDIEFTSFERFIINLYEVLKKASISNVKAYGLDTSNVTIEKVPLGITHFHASDMHRITHTSNEL